ncbi:MAG: GGDEF domain-containing protein [Terracidiphilus sp.]|jgi:diguanylate cyclase (GGDEF)-like protein
MKTGGHDRIVSMKWLIAAVAIVLSFSSAIAQSPAPLTTLRAIHALTNAEAHHELPVAFEATVTYFRSYERTMFVQDGDVAIYVQATTNTKLVPGDRVLIKGTTRDSFRPFVMSDNITFLHHGTVPAALPSTYDMLIRAQRDCMLVSVRARIRAADLVVSSGVSSTNLQMLADGGTIDAVVDSSDRSPFQGLLDADVEITGAASGNFDGKMQQTGILLHVTSMADVKVLKRASVNPSSLPVTPMDRILTGYHVQVLSQRVRVSGTVTYYQPGSAIVLQNGTRSLWIQTHTYDPINIGDLADATGFPGLHDGFLTLTNGEIKDSGILAPVTPLPATWHELAMSGHVFDLVSIEGQVVTEIREAAQDDYVLVSDGQMFSAIYRRAVSITQGAPPPPPMKMIPLGSTLRVTGICKLDDSKPFDAQVPFTVLMRSYDDIAVIAEPSMLTTGNLLRLVTILLLVVIASMVWGVTLKKKVRRQTDALSARAEAEAALERRMAQLEQRRSRILEDINGSRPLAEILEEITEMASFRLNGAPCWCQVSDGARLGHYPSDPESLRVIESEIPARSGPPLGILFAGFAHGTEPDSSETEALTVGSRLASLAIETRRLYSDLLHRSEFDLLTDIHNRFSLEKHLDALIEAARQNAGIFGLIYVDLDEFKQVNDVYGHRVGDLYLQEVAMRMKHQLRPNDMLARLGGDEFAVLVSVVRNRAQAEEIAHRLEHCFDEPFPVEGYVLNGSASVGLAIYPDDGSTRDSLLSSSDAAMYVSKHTKHSNSNIHPDREITGFTPNDLA